MRRRGAESEQLEQKEVFVREAEQRFPPAEPRPQAELTVIGSGARLEGNLISAASLRIEGLVKGQITAEGDVIVAPEAEVDSDIWATNVTISGKYAGNVTANGTIELTSTARVEGNISCRSLIVTQGAVFSGQSIMDGGTTRELETPTVVLEEQE